MAQGLLGGQPGPWPVPTDPVPWGLAPLLPIIRSAGPAAMGLACVLMKPPGAPPSLPEQGSHHLASGRVLSAVSHTLQRRLPPTAEGFSGSRSSSSGRLTRAGRATPRSAGKRGSGRRRGRRPGRTPPRSASPPPPPPPSPPPPPIGQAFHALPTEGGREGHAPR